MPQADNPERRTPNTYNNRQSKEQQKHSTKTDAKTKPKHDTEKDTSRPKTHWRRATRQYLVDQLSEHCWKWSKTPYGKTAKLKRPGLQQIMIDLLGFS